MAPMMQEIKKSMAHGNPMRSQQVATIKFKIVKMIFWLLIFQQLARYDDQKIGQKMPFPETW